MAIIVIEHVRTLISATDLLLKELERPFKIPIIIHTLRISTHRISAALSSSKNKLLNVEINCS